MYGEVTWVLVSSGTQVQPQVILDPDYLPDYPSVSILPHIRITFQFLFPFRRQTRLLLFNGVLFAQEILKELILLFMDYVFYYVALRLENVESIWFKVKNSK